VLQTPDVVRNLGYQYLVDAEIFPESDEANGFDFLKHAQSIPDESSFS
jgi:hypothetical protein